MIELLNLKIVLKVELYIKNVKAYSNYSGSDKIHDVKNAIVKNSLIGLYSNWWDYNNFLYKNGSGIVKKNNINNNLILPHVTHWKDFYLWTCSCFSLYETFCALIICFKKTYGGGFH